MHRIALGGGTELSGRSIVSLDAEQHIQKEVRDGIAFVTFNRPQARNAFTFAMYDRLAEICAEVDGDHMIRAMVLTGAGGKAFASGTDISQFRAFDKESDALDYEARIERVLGALEACRVPTIAAISGACTGGGGGIATCCDLRIGTRNVRFGMPIARTLGNCLSMGNFARFTAILGPALFKEIVFTARLIEADEALSVRLLNEIVEDPDELMPRAEALARKVASHAPLTLQATKAALRRMQVRLAGEEAEDLILMCYMSEDFKEGMDAFLNKRPPQFKGR